MAHTRVAASPHSPRRSRGAHTQLFVGCAGRTPRPPRPQSAALMRPPLTPNWVWPECCVAPRAHRLRGPEPWLAAEPPSGVALSPEYVRGTDWRTTERGPTISVCIVACHACSATNTQTHQRFHYGCTRCCALGWRAPRRQQLVQGVLCVCGTATSAAWCVRGRSSIAADGYGKVALAARCVRRARMPRAPGVCVAVA